MKEQCIGLTLAKELKERGFEKGSEYIWITFFHQNVEFSRSADCMPSLGSTIYRAYTYFDILVTYAEELFGSDSYTKCCGNLVVIDEENYPTLCPNCSDYDGFFTVPAYEFHTERLLGMLQQGKKEEADQCILEAIKNKK